MQRQECLAGGVQRDRHGQEEIHAGTNLIKDAEFGDAVIEREIEFPYGAVRALELRSRSPIGTMRQIRSQGS